MNDQSKRETTVNDRVGATSAGATAGVLLAAAFLTTGAAQAQDRTFDWSGEVASGRTLEVKGVNGAVRAVPSSGREASVRARIEGHGDDPSDVTIEVVEHAGGVTLCAIYPGEENECAPGERGHLGSEDNRVEVEFRVRVPEGVRFAGKTVNGDVEARELRSVVSTRTVNGSIHVSTTRSATAETVNGSIEAEVGKLSGSGPYRYETVNGSVTLSMPEGTGAEVHARTANGGISTDFPLTVQGRFGPRSLEGTVGEGGPVLELRTTNGAIRLRQAS